MAQGEGDRRRSARRADDGSGGAGQQVRTAVATLEAIDEFRWMVEEFRVSVFAQNLQTLVPVSSKRLLAQWDKARTARERLVATLGA